MNELKQIINNLGGRDIWPLVNSLDLTSSMRLLNILILTWFTTLSSAQPCTWSLVQYNTSTGLPTDRIYAVTEDDKGFLWMATDIGLYKFDGSNCIQIQLEEAPGRQIEGTLEDLYFDRQGLLWIGTSGNGVLKYDPLRGTTRQYAANLADTFAIPANRTYGFFEDNEDHLWVTAHGQGLCRYDSANDRFMRVRPYQDESELRRYKDFQHMISSTTRDVVDSTIYWMASLHGLIQWNVRTNNYTYINPSSGPVGFRSIHQDPTGVIWGVTWGKGLWRYIPVDKSWNLFECNSDVKTAFSCHNASDIHQYDEHTLLIASAAGLLFFDTQTLTFDMSCAEQAPLVPERIYAGSNDRLWIIAPGEGIFLLQKERQHFRHLSTSTKVHHLISDPVNGEMYGCGNDTLYHFSPEGHLLSKWTYASFLDPKEKYLTDLFFDQAGQLWVLDAYGLYRLDNNQLVPFKHPGQELLVQNGYYWKALIDSSNKCWLLSQGTGVWSLDLNTRELLHYDYKKDDPHSLIHNYSIANGFIDEDGDVWGGASSGLFYYNQKQKRFVNSNSPWLATDSIAFDSPSAFVQDEEGKIWLGRSLNRLGILDKSKFPTESIKPVPALSTLPRVILNDLVFDDFGNLWIASDEGLVRYQPSSGEVDYFGPSYGIGEVSDLEMRSDGQMLAVVDGDLLIFKPEKMHSTGIAPRPVITAFRVFDQPYKSPDGFRVPNVSKVELKYTQNFFSFDFGAIDYATQLPKEYAYKLEGLDPDWNYPEKGRQYAAYTNVGGGKFVFKVKSRNPGAEWSEEIATLLVSVTPPLWQRAWFILIAVLALGVSIWLVYRYRIEEIRKKETLITAFNKQLAETEMKALRAQMNPHFLFNTLNAIKLYVQKNDQEKAVEYLTGFAKLIRQVLQNSASPLILLSSELEALDLYIKIEQMRFDDKFTYHIKVGEGVSPDTVRIPPLLLQPYVENAIWHGLMHKNHGEGLLLVNLSRTGNCLQCIIEDNGIGREAARRIKSKSAERNKSMGMQITQDRMDITGRTADLTFDVEIEDLSDAQGQATGTRVIVRITEK